VSRSLHRHHACHATLFPVLAFATLALAARSDSRRGGFFASIKDLIATAVKADHSDPWGGDSIGNATGLLGQFEVLIVLGDFPAELDSLASTQSGEAADSLC